MLNLNSVQVRMKSLRITASHELASEDASGQSSSTDSAETGAKAKKLTVSGLIPFKDYEHLADLFAMAEALENGARGIYRISNTTASALGIKQVRFSGKVEASEQEIMRQWRVSFNLSEYRSVPEKKEERQSEPEANEQGGNASESIQYASIQKSLDEHFATLRT